MQGGKKAMVADKKNLWLKPHTFRLIFVGDLCNLKFCDDNSGMILIYQLLICQHQSSQLNGMPLPTVWCVVEIEIHNRQFS